MSYVTMIEASRGGSPCLVRVERVAVGYGPPSREIFLVVVPAVVRAVLLAHVLRRGASAAAAERGGERIARARSWLDDIHFFGLSYLYGATCKLVRRPNATELVMLRTFRSSLDAAF